MYIRHVSPLNSFAGGKYPSILVNQDRRRANSSHSSYNKFSPHKNEQWIDFRVQLARTTGGRLNDYVTTTPLQLSENNNHGLGRILRPSKIKGEWERDRQKEEGWEADFMVIVGGCKHVWLFVSNFAAEQNSLSQNPHGLRRRSQEKQIKGR